MAEENPLSVSGIRFTCLRCGACCRDPGEDAHVFLRQGDLERLCEALVLSAREFAASYLVAVEGYICLASHEGDCIFLDEAQGCRVYEARPLQCRTWPFWPQNMGPQGLLDEVTQRCPGVGSGPPMDEAVILRCLQDMSTLPLVRVAEPEEEG